MSLTTTPIADLDRDRVPVHVLADVRSARPAPQALVSQEGILKDAGGEVHFTVWKDCRARTVKAGKKYLFYRAALGLRNGVLELRLTAGSAVYPVKNAAAAERVLKRLAGRERGRLLRVGRKAAGEGLLSRSGMIRILITVAVALWALLIVLHFAGVLTQKRADEILGRLGLVELEHPGLTRVTGVVEEVLDARTVKVLSGGDVWVVHYKGILVPDLVPDAAGRLKPSALQARNFNRFLAGGQTASFEFAGEVPEAKEVWGYLFVKEKMANEELLSRGLAWLAGTTDELEYADRLRAAEETARIKKMGIWREKENRR